MQNYRNAREMNAVLGGIADNEFILEMKESTKILQEKFSKLFQNLNPID